MLWHLEKLQIPKDKLIAYFNEPNASLPNPSHIAPFKDDMEVAVAAVSRKGTLLHEFSDRIKNDKDVVLLAVNQDPTAIASASKTLRGDIDIARACLYPRESNNKNNDYLSYFSDDIKNNYGLIASSMCNVRFASEAIRNDKPLMTELVKDNYRQFQYAGDILKNDVEFCRLAIAQEATNIKFVPAESPLKSDKSFCIEVLTKNPDCLEYFPKFKDNAEVVLHAVRTENKMIEDKLTFGFRDQSVINHASDRLKKVVGDNDAEKSLNSLVLLDKLSNNLAPKKSHKLTMKI